MRKSVDEKQRIMEWEQLIEECRSRPKDMSMDAWCRQTGGSKTNYYYWLRKLKKKEPEELHPDGTPEIVRIPEDISDMHDEGSIDIRIGRISIRVTEETWPYSSLIPSCIFYF
ncbi:MAG: hypothetical protein IJV16_08295 [Lachnospiraceae bacterium]|nr:hypothetical protein [Lachnospiraceae bacterium]